MLRSGPRRRRSSPREHSTWPIAEVPRLVAASAVALAIVAGAVTAGAAAVATAVGPAAGAMAKLWCVAEPELRSAARGSHAMPLFVHHVC